MALTTTLEKKQNQTLSKSIEAQNTVEAALEALSTNKLNKTGKAVSSNTADKLANTTAIGSTIKPVYFTDKGVPAACTYKLEKDVPSNAVFTDTHYTTKLYVTGSTGTTNAQTSNGATYLRLFDNDTNRASIKITGAGATKVSSDSNGVITINSTDNNTTYSAGTGLSLSGTTFSVKTGYTTDANNRNYKVAADSSGNLYVNVPWSVGGTLDTSLSSSSTNALQNKAIYSAFSSAVGYDNNYYVYGEKGSWRIIQYNATGNSLDIRYGIIAINSQSANYSVSFSKNFTSTQYTVVFGLYRSNTQSWFWSPIVQSKTTSGFTVFLRGNSSGDNGGTIMYIAIRSN